MLRRLERPRLGYRLSSIDCRPSTAFGCLRQPTSNRSSATKPDNHVVAVDDHGNVAPTATVLEHPLQISSVLLNVIVLKWYVPPGIIITGGSRVWSSSFAEDVDHHSTCLGQASGHRPGFGIRGPTLKARNQSPALQSIARVVIITENLAARLGDRCSANGLPRTCGAGRVREQEAPLSSQRRSSPR